MSLDHTPAAARRERKARAAKRRKQQLAAAAAAKVSFESTSISVRVDASPTSSDNMGSASTIRDGYRVDDAQVERDVSRALDWSDCGLVSGQSSPGSVINSDIEFLNHAQMRLNKSEQRTNDVPLAHALGLERQPELQLNPLLTPSRSPAQETVSKTQQELLPPVQMTHTVGVEWKAYRASVPAAARQPLPGSVEPLKLRDDASLDTAIDHAMNDMVSSSGIKKEYTEMGIVSFRDSVAPELNMTHPHGDWKDTSVINRAQHVGSTIKSQAPLVSVFEDSSHAMLLNAFSPAVDPLFAPCSTEAAGLKGF